MHTRYICVEGSPKERGERIGQLLKDQIQCNYINQKEFYRNTQSFDYTDWEDQVHHYLPAIRKWAPEVLEEMEGMASGSKMDLKQILALSTAYEKSFNRNLVSDKCTSFLLSPSVTKDKETIIGQTNDECFREWLSELDLVIHHVDQNKEVLIYTHPGIPAYMGINNHGLAVMWTYIDNGQIGDGLPTNIMIRHLLNLKNVDEGIEFLSKVCHDIPNQFGLADSNGNIASVECFPNQVYFKKNESFLVHTNHTIIGQEKECTCSSTTYNRYKMMKKQIQNNLGRIDTECAKDFLKSHEGYPNCICVHPFSEKPFNKTLASMVFNLTKGQMHIAFGNACETPFQTFCFDSYLISE